MPSVMPDSGAPTSGSSGPPAATPESEANHKIFGADPQLTFTRRLPLTEVELSVAQWRACENRHRTEVDDLTAGHRERGRRGQAHPVEDFLFTYYTYRPNQLRRWHPGVGVILAQAAERADWPFYRTVGADAVAVDVASFRERRAGRLAQVRRTLEQTLGSPGQFGCFGLHEWAMVFGQTHRRHDAVPLRLGQAGTDQVVHAAVVRCSHHDAVRFFTPAARPRNELDPPAEPWLRQEQPGCLHAGMDLYKWAYQLAPAVPSDLVLDCFRLARRIRELDMRASPYDLSGYGYEPVRIETPAGKAEYVAAQRGFTEEAQGLRHRLLTVLDALDALHTA